MSWRTNPNEFEAAKRTIAAHYEIEFDYVKVSVRNHSVAMLDDQIDKAQRWSKAFTLFTVLERLQKDHSQNTPKLFEELEAEIRDAVAPFFNLP